MIEIGKTYKHPEIISPYTALKKEGEYWIMVSAVSMIRNSIEGYELSFSDYWKISEDYFNKSNMKEYDLKNLVLDEDFTIIST